MSTRASKTDHEGAQAPDEPPYEGEVGRTRLEHVHVTIPGGFVRSIQVYEAVNVASDQKLRQAALSGALHRFEGGEELAVSFVFHDPGARRFALVVPESLRHQELRERARLLQRLADDTSHPIPPYVREARVVIGVRELNDYLVEVSASARVETLKRQVDALQRTENDLDRRAEQLGQREERLRARAEEVTRREDDMRALAQELDVRQSGITAIEEKLPQRIAELDEREVRLRRRQEAMASSSASATKDPPGAPAEAVEEAWQDDVEDIEELEELEEIEPVETDGSGPLADAVEMVGSADELADGILEEVEDVERVEELDEGVEEILDDEDVEELDVADVREVTGVTTVAEASREGSGAPRMQDGHTEIAAAASLGAVPVPPPAGFLEDRNREMAACLDEGIWLFAKLEEGHEQAFLDGTDLLTQLVVVQGRPVVILSLVDGGEARPYVRRMAIAPQDSQDRALLDSLRRRFEASVAIFGPDGRFERTVEVSAPRRVNVAMVLERVARMETEAQIDPATAKERALAAPPPVRLASHPFQTEDPPPSENALEASKRLARLFEWCTPEKLDRALLALSVPRDVVDGSIRGILEDAVGFGLTLPSPLASRALSVGVAAEPGELVVRQLRAFRATVEAPDRGGLTLEDIADNWEQLLAAAEDSETPVDDDTRDLAWDAIRKVRGDSTGSPALADVDPTKLPDMGKPELVMLLDHPKVRREAALELLRRSDPELLETLYKAVRKMPRTEVVRVVPRIAGFGESAGDALIDGLGARKTFVRQASALAVGHLKLRRAVVPLVHLLQTEPSEVWREVARVLGEFGSSAFRAIARAMKDPKGHEERFTEALAHLANHGCEGKVEKLTQDGDKGVAVLALEALNLRPAAKQVSAIVRGKAALAADDSVLAFSRRFYEELLGTAPDADLADPE